MLNYRYDELVKELKKEFPGMAISIEESMKSHTTFRIGGPADIFIEPDMSDFFSLIRFLKKNNATFTVIGNGSNLLVSDDGIEGVVISLGKNISDIKIDKDIVTVQPGAMLSSVANVAAEAGLTGLEFASGIPGTIGGAVFMNAGAYGGEIKDVIESVTVLTEDLEEKIMTASDLDLSYRHSLLMDNGGYVGEVTLRLRPGDKDAIRSRMDEIKEQRIAKQPLNYPSAGSTFKRPTGYFAGKLVDDAGLRGYTVGGAQVSEKHCGFVINKSNATASDVLRLMHDVDEKVFSMFGVHLTPEVRIIGRNVN